MSSEQPLRTALIGFGVAGAVFHAPLIAANSRFQLSAVVTGDAARRQQVGASYPEVEVLPDAASLFARADEFDLVVIASPNRSHFSLASSALDAGLPVVLDKPMTTAAEQGRTLIAHARKAGLPLTVFQNRRWDGDMRTVRALLDSGELGRVHRFEARFERWVPAVKPGWREGGSAEEAGGVLYDLGSHLVDQALHLFGPVSSVYAELDCHRPGAEVDDDAFVALTHRSGVRSHLWMGKLVAALGPRFRVLGDQAGYTKYRLDPQEDALRSGGVPGELGWGTEEPEHWGELGVPGEVRRWPTESGCYPAFYDQLADALRNGAALPVDPADSVAGLEIIAAARRSAETGSVQHMT